MSFLTSLRLLWSSRHSQSHQQALDLMSNQGVPTYRSPPAASEDKSQCNNQHPIEQTLHQHSPKRIRHCTIYSDNSFD